jgi:hypothetical protein
MVSVPFHEAGVRAMNSIGEAVNGQSKRIDRLLKHRATDCLPSP